MTSQPKCACPSAEIDPALGDLIAEITDRLQAGKPVDIEPYLARHPEWADRLRQLLPALAVMAGLGSSLGEPSAGDVRAGGEPLAGTLGDFRIVREVGRGGMGVVYEAEQISLGRRVALKVLPMAGTLDPRRLQRFHNEARAAACLHHTNIVPVFAVGSERGVHFYAMQLIEGQTLAGMIQLQRGPAPAEAVAPLSDRTVSSATAAATPHAAAGSTVPQARLSTTRPAQGAAYFRKVAELAAQAAAALDYAHQMGVVHRDIKPANLMLDGHGTVWITDFGLAQLQTDAGPTLTGDLVGTLRYMSPEQALAQRVVIDHRTDVYSLGATLYELLALRPVFAGSDRQELLRQIAFDEPLPPRRLNRAIPAELETIVLKALEKNPADRYATAKELADDLRRWLEDRPIRARRAGVLQRLRKLARRHRAVVTAAAVCLLVTLVALAGSLGWILSDRAGRQRDAESRILEALELAQPLLREGNPANLALLSAVQRVERIWASVLSAPRCGDKRSSSCATCACSPTWTRPACAWQIRLRQTGPMRRRGIRQRSSGTGSMCWRWTRRRRRPGSAPRPSTNPCSRGWTAGCTSNISGEFLSVSMTHNGRTCRRWPTGATTAPGGALSGRWWWRRASRTSSTLRS